MAMMDEIDRMVKAALAEDIGSGDITSESVLDPESGGKGIIHAKSEMVLAGIEFAIRTFRAVDKDVRFDARFSDGDRLQPGDKIAFVEGRLRSLLATERTALNFLQRASGIATLTARYVERVRGDKAKILDTRKTAPGLRALDKAAVRAGGGTNHRFGLFDAVLIKDNHIAAAGGVREALTRAKRSVSSSMRTEVEVTNNEEIDEAIEAGADLIMLDNMNVGAIAEAVARIAGRAEIEVSGNVNLDMVADIARAGVDFISVGALTHSAPAADISMDIRKL